MKNITLLPPEQRRVETDRLILEDFNTAHIPAMNAYLPDPLFGRYIMLYDFDANKLLSNYQGGWATSPYRYYWGIRHKETNDVIGAVRLDDWTGEEGINIHYEIAPKFWNNGYATEASQTVISFAFRQAGVEMITATVHPENGASNRVADKLGIHFECLIKNFFKHQSGEWQDRNFYRLMKADFKGYGV